MLLQEPCCQFNFLHVLLSLLCPLLVYEVCQSSWYIQVFRPLLSFPSTFCEGWTTNMEQLDWVPHITCSQPTTLSLHPPQDPIKIIKYLKSSKFRPAAFAVSKISVCTSNDNSVTRFHQAVVKQDARQFCSKSWKEIEKSSEKSFNHSQLLKVQPCQCRLRMNHQQQNDTLLR